MFLLRYPSHFIENQFTRFFSDHLLFYSFLPMIENEKQYQLLRDRIRLKSITKSWQTNPNVTRNEIGPNRSHPDKLPSSTSNSPTPMLSDKTKQQDRIIIHYIHEGRFRSFKKDLHQIHQNVFKNTPALGTRLIVGNRNRRSAKFELIRKRPSRKLLKNIPLRGNRFL